MSELRGIYCLWLREVRRFLRDRSRLIGSVITPILWLVIFGTGLRFSLSSPGFNYQEFLFPGILGQTLLFTAMFMGISVIWDRQFGFMKEILVAPISRTSIFTGKMLGVGTSAMIQGLIVLALGAIIGVPLGLYQLGMAIPLMALITVGLVCIGLILASLMTSLESFGTIATFVNMPMFFLSGALFPVSVLPLWLKWAFYLNPLTYGVDALRTVIMSGWQPLLPLQYDILIICIFDLAVIVVGTYAFSRRS
ncbi:MAG TPA: ABC transporter permease [Methanocella sp.]|nr:ABC transporter permease [Methanocella sp.]